MAVIPVKRRLRIIIYGKVQGVNFRYETKFLAKGLGLTGWVKNNHDGTVEVMAEGSEDKLKELARWCVRGPKDAEIEKIETEWLPPNGKFTEFRIDK